VIVSGSGNRLSQRSIEIFTHPLRLRRKASRGRWERIIQRPLEAKQVIQASHFSIAMLNRGAE
jgi:hypothetical protein